MGSAGQTACSRPRSLHRGADTGAGAAPGTTDGSAPGALAGGAALGDWQAVARAWSPFPGLPAARLEIGSQHRLHHTQIVWEPPGQREQRVASVPPRWSHRDGLPRTELPPNFSLLGSQGEVELP